jgi:hypothetical protein
MKVTFVYGVDFVRLPLDPPTIENCRKCAFYMAHVSDGCIRCDHRICNIGRSGYFIKNYMREVPDIISNAKLEG